MNKENATKADVIWERREGISETQTGDIGSRASIEARTLDRIFSEILRLGWGECPRAGTLRLHRLSGSWPSAFDDLQDNIAARRRRGRMRNGL